MSAKRPRKPPGSSLSPGPRLPGILDEAVEPSSYHSASFSPTAPSTAFANGDGDGDILMTDADDDSEDFEEDDDADADDEKDYDDDNEEEEDSDIDLDPDEVGFHAQSECHHGHQDPSYYHNPHYQHHYSFFDAYDEPSDEDMGNASMPSILGLGMYKHTGEMDASVFSSSSGEFVFSNDELKEDISDDESLGMALGLFYDAGLASPPEDVSHDPSPPDALAVTAHLEQLQEVSPQHPTASNPNPFMLGSNNLGLVDFLLRWAAQGRSHQVYPEDRNQFLTTSGVQDMDKPEIRVQEHIQHADLQGDACDLQGINWQRLGVTREEARERRLHTYDNFVHNQGSDRWQPHLPDTVLPRLDSFFRFRRMDLRRNINLSHFQLRNVLATPGHNAAYYPSAASGVHRLNLSTGNARPGMKLQDGEGSQVTTLAAKCGVLAAGFFSGEYLVQNLTTEAENEWHEGLVTSDNGITNHVEVYQPRSSSSPVAAFASNDLFFRVMDLTTQRWLSEVKYDKFPLNCTAVSPDGRFRVMVGDSQDVVIALAEPQYSSQELTILHELSGHRDFGFACAWADDGVTVATGFQDKTVKIWDARRWVDNQGTPTPVCTLRSEMANVRSLRFSPVGSGQRVLVAAEEADYVNIIDARTYRSKQTIDVFSEIGGISFSDDGQDLTVLCCDQTRGGIMQLERCGLGAEGHVDLEDIHTSQYTLYGFPMEKQSDWPRSLFTQMTRVRETDKKRRRKAAKLQCLAPF